MSNPFFDHPILNSPYDCPARHWELDETGQPTQQIIENRRRAQFITPIPKPKKQKKAAATQDAFVFDEGKRAVDARRSSTTRPRSSTRCAAMSMPGAPCPTRTSGRSRRKRRACCSTGATITVQRHPPVLLPGRSGRDRDLADRGRAAEQARQAPSSTTWPAPTATPTRN